MILICTYCSEKPHPMYYIDILQHKYSTLSCTCVVANVLYQFKANTISNDFYSVSMQSLRLSCINIAASILWGENIYYHHQLESIKLEEK